MYECIALSMMFVLLIPLCFYLNKWLGDYGYSKLEININYFVAVNIYVAVAWIIICISLSSKSPDMLTYGVLSNPKTISDDLVIFLWGNLIALLLRLFLKFDD